MFLQLHFESGAWFHWSCKLLENSVRHFTIKCGRIGDGGGDGGSDPDARVITLHVASTAGRPKSAPNRAGNGACRGRTLDPATPRPAHRRPPSAARRPPPAARRPLAVWLGFERPPLSTLRVS